MKQKLNIHVVKEPVFKVKRNSLCTKLSNIWKQISPLVTPSVQTRTAHDELVLMQHSSAVAEQETWGKTMRVLNVAYLIFMCLI